MTERAVAAFALALAVAAAAAPGPADAQDARPSLTEITEAWLASPHADRSSEAFTHWNEDGEIPGSCAVCHSSVGLIDYLRGPMDSVGAIASAVPLGSVVDCAACHGAAAADLSAVPFPSGVHVALSGESAVCSVCHQGRASTAAVDAATGASDADAVQPDLSFVNSHYTVAAATSLGSAVHGGYEYAGRSYAGPFTHVPAFNTCTSCHAPHGLEVEIASCTGCHQGAAEFAAIRTSPTDYDGDGDVSEGIADPIATLHAALETAIKRYGTEVAGQPVIYAAGVYPYFFADTDGDGAVSDGEAAYPNRYRSWTPRLLRAAYNYQFVRQDGGAFAHNPHYALQLLYDSLADLGTVVAVDVSGFTRP